MIYGVLTQLAGPWLRRHLQRRAARGKEDKARLGERLGRSPIPRPHGKLVWFHGASVGEGVALLALIDALRVDYPSITILVTTGTVTSAQILARRLPPGAIHQYVPLDRVAWVNAFLDHWNPDIVIWTESEIWPNLLRGIAQRRIPAAMVNGRLSAHSAKHWRLLAATFKNLLSAFSVRLAQSDADVQRFAALGIIFKHVGNLKLAVQPAPADEKVLADLRSALSDRSMWLAASTHPGEEAILLNTHSALTKLHPDLLLIIVPRHPERGDEIAALAKTSQLSFDQRSKGALPGHNSAVYIADTLGELGTFYELAPIVFIGGSLTFDGHSPIEAAQREVAIVYGPQMRNNASVAALLEDAGGAVRVAQATDVFGIVSAWLDNPHEAQTVALAAKAVADNGQDVVVRILHELRPLLVEAGIA